MAGGKEIRTQIASIKNTQKITRAMQMVAAAKMRKAQDRMHASRPYAEKMRTVIGHLALAHPEHKHEFLTKRDVKRVGYIIVSTDRGLCGGLNINLFKREPAAQKNAFNLNSKVIRQQDSGRLNNDWTTDEIERSYREDGQDDSSHDKLRSHPVV